MYLPPQAFEHRLSELVTIPRSSRTVIGRTVAFDTQEVPAGRIGIDHGEVDAVAGAPDLVVHFEASGANPIGHHLLEL
jgi:hypothetical protein